MIAGGCRSEGYQRKSYRINTVTNECTEDSPLKDDAKFGITLAPLVFGGSVYFMQMGDIIHKLHVYDIRKKIWGMGIVKQ